MTISFHALADDRRRDIVDLLLDAGELPVGAIVAHMPIAQSGVSRHLRILRDAGFVRSRTEGQQRLYSLRPEPFEALDAWLSRYRRVWENRLDNLDAELARRTAAASTAAPSGPNPSPSDPTSQERSTS
jgi:DNA-binding transcriptional ArsR family regulator